MQVGQHAVLAHGDLLPVEGLVFNCRCEADFDMDKWVIIIRTFNWYLRYVADGEDNAYKR